MHVAYTCSLVMPNMPRSSIALVYNINNNIYGELEPFFVFPLMHSCVWMCTSLSWDVTIPCVRLFRQWSFQCCAANKPHTMQIFVSVNWNPPPPLLHLLSDFYLNEVWGINLIVYNMSFYQWILLIIGIESLEVHFIFPLLSRSDTFAMSF